MNAEIIRNALCETDRLYFERQTALNLGGIAIGTGPSFYEWIKRPLTPGVRYGCGVASQYISLDVYCINSTDHKGNVPRNGETIFATERTLDCIRPIPGRPVTVFPWPKALPIAQQVGGMAVHFAAINHHRIGLVGFCKPIEPGIDDEFRAILHYWKAKGRVFVSLMKESAFDDLLEKGWTGE